MTNISFTPAGTAAIALADFVAFVGVACNGSTNTPVSPSSIIGPSAPAAIGASQLAGTWQLLELQHPGDAAQAAPAGATYQLTLADDRASTKADCNICNGSSTLLGETLTIGPLMACTRAACPTMDFETAYVAILAGGHTEGLAGNTLVLGSPRGRLSFTR